MYIDIQHFVWISSSQTINLYPLLFVLNKIGSQLNLSNLSSLCDLENMSILDINLLRPYRNVYYIFFQLYPTLMVLGYLEHLPHRGVYGVPLWMYNSLLFKCSLISSKYYSRIIGFYDGE